MTLKRLVLRKMALSPASGAGGLPRLLPLGLFHDVPRVLSLYDVRMVVDDKVFAEYLAFFRSQLRQSRDATPGPSIVTVSGQQCCGWGLLADSLTGMPRPLGCTVQVRVFLISKAALPLPSNSTFGSCGEAAAGRRAIAVGGDGDVCSLAGCGSAAATLLYMGL